MRLLYINGTLMDLDEQTSLGIDFQAYDIKDPSKRKVNISNKFTLPKTAHNMAVFGFADNPQSTSNIIYDSITCDYWQDNNHLIESGLIRVEEISDRINLYFTGKNTIWEDLKLLSWDTFVDEYMVWAKDVKGLPVSQPTNNDFNDFISYFPNATDGIILPFYYGNFLNSIIQVETKTKIILSYHKIPILLGIYGGGHFCIFAKSIFEFIEYKYGVNFCVSEVGITGNIWDDAIASIIYTPAKSIYVKNHVEIDGSSITILGYSLETDSNVIFEPLNDVKDKDDKTLFDFCSAFFQKFNIIIDNILLSDGTKAFRLARFDDIETMAEVIDFSKKIQSITSFKPNLSGYAQHNIIKIGSLYPEAAENFGSRDIVCLNKNLDANADLFSVDEYIANFKQITNDVIPDLSIQESFKTFEFFLTTGFSSDLITIESRIRYGIGWIDSSTTLNLPIPAHYSLDNEYLFLEEIIQKPKVYTIKKWLSINDIFSLEFFKQYYIRELNGSFFINKISGFNPDKSTEPTTIELIRISDKTPTPVFDEDYWTDGDLAIFTDGFGNNFY